MEATNLLNFINTITSDQRVTVWHTAIYVALLKTWHENDLQNPFKISRRAIMGKAHIGSIVTYHKCIRELQEFGYIEYHPTFHPSEASRLTILQCGLAA